MHGFEFATRLLLFLLATFSFEIKGEVVVMRPQLLALTKPDQINAAVNMIVVVAIVIAIHSLSTIPPSSSINTFYIRRRHAEVADFRRRS